MRNGVKIRIDYTSTRVNATPSSERNWRRYYLYRERKREDSERELTERRFNGDYDNVCRSLPVTRAVPKYLTAETVRLFHEGKKKKVLFGTNPSGEKIDELWKNASYIINLIYTGF